MCVHVSGPPQTSPQKVLFNINYQLIIDYLVEFKKQYVATLVLALVPDCFLHVRGQKRRVRGQREKRVWDYADQTLQLT